MGHVNEVEYLRSRKLPTPARVLEVGSRRVGSPQAFRAMYAGSEFIGMDAQAGDGVDVVADLTDALASDSGILKAASFDLVICCSVLEHVRQPWFAAQAIASLMRPGAALYLSVPWVWRWHPYPDDYWRFSWQGVEALFPTLAWTDFTFSTYIPGEFFPATAGTDDKRSYWVGGKKYLPYLELHGIGRKA